MIDSNDPVSRMGRQVPATWALSLCPAAYEGGGGFIPSRRADQWRGVRGQAADHERAAREAGRRARRQLRCYCAANRLNRLGTLTYAGDGCHEPRQVRAHVGDFFRRLRRELGGNALPYAWVPEWHKTDHGLHLHFAVGRFIARKHIESAWGRGFVHIKHLGDLPVGTTAVEEGRVAGGYLSKYVTKDFGRVDRPRDLHRFDVAQGFQPRRVRITGTSAEQLIAKASGGWFGSTPIRVWSSAEVEGWQGAPAIWAQWR